MSEDRFVRDYQQDQYNQAVQEIRNRPIGGYDGRGSGGVGGGAGNAASWALLLAMLGAIVGAVTGGIGGALLLATIGGAAGWGLRTILLRPSAAGAPSRLGILLFGVIGACAGAGVGMLIGAGDATRSANAMLNWAIFGFVGAVGYKLIRRRGRG